MGQVSGAVGPFKAVFVPRARRPDAVPQESQLLMGAFSSHTLTPSPSPAHSLCLVSSHRFSFRRRPVDFQDADFFAIPFVNKGYAVNNRV